MASPGAAGLFDDHRHRVGFVQQAELAGLSGGLESLVAGIHEDAAKAQDAVDLRDHRDDPAHLEILAASALLAGPAFGDVALDRLFPVTSVRNVDRELDGFFGDADVLPRQQEFAEVPNRISESA